METPPPPPRSTFKVNFNGAVFRENNFAGVGVMIRDDKGLVLASMFEKYLLPYLVTAIEVIVASKALWFALDNGLTSIILEGDSKITIETLKCADASLAAFGNLVEEAKILASRFTAVEFCHISR